jgi:hypothetical protein
MMYAQHKHFDLTKTRRFLKVLLWLMVCRRVQVYSLSLQQQALKSDPNSGFFAATMISSGSSTTTTTTTNTPHFHHGHSRRLAFIISSVPFLQTKPVNVVRQ